MKQELSSDSSKKKLRNKWGRGVVEKQIINLMIKYLYTNCNYKNSNILHCVKIQQNVNQMMAHITQADLQVKKAQKDTMSLI